MEFRGNYWSIEKAPDDIRSLSRFAAADADRNCMLVVSRNLKGGNTFRFFNLDIVAVLCWCAVERCYSMTSLKHKLLFTVKCEYVLKFTWIYL